MSYVYVLAASMINVWKLGEEEDERRGVWLLTLPLKLVLDGPKQSEVENFYWLDAKKVKRILNSKF